MRGNSGVCDTLDGSLDAIPCTPAPSFYCAQYYNDLYGFDLDAYFRTNQTCNGGAHCWVQLIGNGVTGMPSPRNSFSWDVYGSGLVLFGGFYHDIASGGTWTSCTPAAKCVFYNDGEQAQ